MELIKQDLRPLLRTHLPFLSDPALQQAIVEQGKLFRFRAGEIIMDFGNPVGMLPLVLEGTIRVTREDDDGREILLYYLTGGETCVSSYTCCMRAKRSYFKTVAEEDTLLIGLPVHVADDWMTQFRNWKDFIMQAYEGRILDLIDALDSITFLRMDERLLRYLREKSYATGSKVIKATHQQIAQDLNASREAISRLLKRFEKEGKVRLGRNRIELV